MEGIMLQTQGLLNLEEARTRIGISEITIYRWMRSGRIVPIKILGTNYFSAKEVEELRLKKEQEHARKAR